MKVTLRSVLPADAKPIARILHQNKCAAEFSQQESKFQENRVRMYLQEISETPHSWVFVAVIPSGLVIGYIHCILIPVMFSPAPQLLISQLYVAPEQQSEGVEAQMLAYAESVAEENHAVQIEVQALIKDTETLRTAGYEELGTAPWGKSLLKDKQG